MKRSRHAHDHCSNASWATASGRSSRLPARASCVKPPMPPSRFPHLAHTACGCPDGQMRQCWRAPTSKRESCYHFATQLLSTRRDRRASGRMADARKWPIYRTYRYEVVSEVITLAELQNRGLGVRVPPLLPAPNLSLDQQRLFSELAISCPWSWQSWFTFRPCWGSEPGSAPCPQWPCAPC
jgi:hypothetical protein